MFKKSVPTSNKTRFLITKITCLTLFKETIAVGAENRTKHENTLYVQNSELVNVKTGGIYSYRRALNG
jgi:hypothetical protein